MGIFDRIISNLTASILSSLQSQLAIGENQYILNARGYRMGVQPSQIKVRPGQFDDNLVLNFAGLVVSRSVSQMLGNGVTFDFDGETETAQEQYITRVLEANKQEILFHRLALAAAEAGTGYALMVPDGVIGEDGQAYPRIVLLDPAFMVMDHLPEDCEIVIRYTQQYKFTGADGKQRERRRVWEHVSPDVDAEGNQTGGNYWTDTVYERPDGGREVQISTAVWEYDFPPVIHWQNLPNVGTPYGESDIPHDVLRLQDRINFSSGNLSKIVRLFAHPMRYGKMLGKPEMILDEKGRPTGRKGFETGPDDMPMFQTESAEIVQLSPVGDLTAALEVYRSQRQSFFDVTRSVDIDSMSDKLGALTNFGLRVLYQDNLAKIATKRALFGDALIETVRRVQVLAGMQPVHCVCIWPDFLSQDDVSLTNKHVQLVGASIESKQTAALDLGLDWETEQERMEGERAGEDNIGAAILRAFNQGGGAETEPAEMNTERAE